MSFTPFPRYKQSGVDWIPMIPADWKAVRTKEVVNFTTGWTPPTGDSASYEGNNLWANISDLGPRQLVDTAKRVSDGAVESSRLKPSPKGSLLFSFKLSVGQVSFAGRDMFTNEAIATFRPSHLLHLGFAYYALPLFLLQNAEENVYGAKLLNQELIRSARFPLPSFAAQAEIASFLDWETRKIDELVEEQRRLIALLDEKLKAVISHTVTKGLKPDVSLKASGTEWVADVPEHWKVGKCGFYLNLLSGYAFPSAGFTADDADTRLLRGANVGVGRLRWDDVVYWRRTLDDGLEAWELRAGDIVVGMDRPLIAGGMRVARISEKDLPSLLLQRVAAIRTGSELHSRYLQSLLSSHLFAAHFTPETTGVSVPHISPEQIRDFTIPIPPLSEQAEIVSFIESAAGDIGCLRRAAEDAVALLVERRSALITAAVTGQIDVRALAPTEAP